MIYFSIQDTLLSNAYEFAPNATLTDEWTRLLFEELYLEWLGHNEELSDEPMDIAALISYMDAQYEAFMTKLVSAYDPPAFKANNIDQLPSGAYRVRLMVGDERIAKSFDSLDEARLFRNDMLKHPKVGGFMSRPYAKAA